MIRLAVRGFNQSILSFRTLLFGALVLGYGMFDLAILSAFGPGSPWDVIIPVASSTFTTSLVGMIWWCLWLFPVMRSAQLEHVQLRHGSRRRVVLDSIAFLAGVLMSWGVVQLAIYAALTLHLGVTIEWGTPAAEGSVSAFSADAFATHFESPLAALVCIAAFTGLSYVALASVVIAGSATGRPRAALACLIAFALWAVICNFIAFNLPLVFDFSALLSLGWALASTGGMAVWITWLVGAGLLAWALIRVRTFRDVRVALTSSWSWMVAMTICALLAALYTASGAQHANVSATFFAGADRDLLGYVLVAAIPLLFTTGNVVQLAELRSGPISYQALRQGSYRAWMLRLFARQAIRTIIAVLLVALVITIVLGPEAIWQSESAGVTLAGLGGLFTEMLLMSAVAGLLAWAPVAMEHSWLAVFAATLVLGYALPASIAAVNIAAPYAVRLGFSPTITLTSSLVAVVLGALVAFVAWLRATPSRAEVFA